MNIYIREDRQRQWVRITDRKKKNRLTDRKKDSNTRSLDELQYQAILIYYFRLTDSMDCANNTKRYRLYLEDFNNAVKDVSTAITFLCKDKTFFGDFSGLTKYSQTLSEIVQVACETCGQCIFLPDFTVHTVSKLYELLSNGETIVGSRKEMYLVTTLQRVLGGKGVIMMEPQFSNEQCGHCLRYKSL